ncbi:hypothetical protein B0H16DRAFT_1900564 [Mycena metata]|uniref:Uncharacterized protein n=1 Tax=Mycena metata TaxID=1033252 RepID=A0AAD7H4A4_9AGAR|nr:hypothetical protein B0H16DRAFT_1900564 [Mycena metata]
MSTVHHTRSATRAGVLPPPAAIYSPARYSFGSVDDLLDMDTPAIDPSMSIPASAGKPNASASLETQPNASASLESLLTPVVEQSASAARAGDVSSESATPLADSVDWGVLGDLPAPRGDANDGGWTPVTRKTARSHRESSESESTIARATREMSHEDREALARRHEAYAAQLRGVSAQATSSDSKESEWSNVEKSSLKIDHQDSNGSSAEPRNTASTVPRRATVEEVTDEEDPEFSPPHAGPSRDKGKGTDPRNWGDVESLVDFSENDLEAQREALANFAETNRIIKEEPFSTPASPALKEPQGEPQALKEP